ncbi:hypothetical protein [Chamaesiphon sp. VAR_48_metabat_135_sub]|uniref:hypothetical protein n=1 Tax=Chamaesiphon sp. VAR_48_metabat_135_sub TaxID=2964699 RepID=UPI00286B846E|nr:hypothetical protein [Chamaesiphon sp. VAR_48_metabat_135_sub]
MKNKLISIAFTLAMFGGSIPYIPATFAQPESNQPIVRDRSPSVELKFVRRMPGKPPLTRFTFDLTIRSHSSNSQWFIFPTTIHEHNLKPKIQPISNLAAREYRDKENTAILIRLDTPKNGTLFALLLAGNTEIKLRNLEIGVWGNYPSELPIEFVTTNNLTIDGKSVETYSGIKNLAIAKSVELDGQKDSKTLFEYERDPNLKRSQLIQVEATNPKMINLSISTRSR